MYIYHWACHFIFISWSVIVSVICWLWYRWTLWLPSWLSWQELWPQCLWKLLLQGNVFVTHDLFATILSLLHCVGMCIMSISVFLFAILVQGHPTPPWVTCWSLHVLGFLEGGAQQVVSDLLCTFFTTMYYFIRGSQSSLWLCLLKSLWHSFLWRAVILIWLALLYVLFILEVHRQRCEAMHVIVCMLMSQLLPLPPHALQEGCQSGI